MWFERFVIIATTLARDFIPSSWSYYTPSWVEVGIYLFTFGLFGTLYLIFMRVAPVVACAEIKSILKSSGDQYVGPQYAELTGLNNTGVHHDEDDHLIFTADEGYTSTVTGSDTVTLTRPEVDTDTDVNRLDDRNERLNDEDDDLDNK